MIPRPLDNWRETFVLQARLQELPGDRIGEALAEIDAHCADSGEEPQEAFGDPVDYAATVARGPGGGARTRIGWIALAGLLPLGGIHSLLSGVQALAEGTRGVLTVGKLIGIAAGAVVVVLIATLILRPGQRRITGPLALAMVGGLAVVVAPQYLWERPVIEAPGGVLLAIGVLLLALAWWPLVSGRLPADRVIDPRTGTDRLAMSRWLETWLRWGLPASAVLVGVTLTAIIVYFVPD